MNREFPAKRLFYSSIPVEFFAMFKKISLGKKKFSFMFQYFSIKRLFIDSNNMITKIKVNPAQ